MWFQMYVTRIAPAYVLHITVQCCLVSKAHYDALRLMSAAQRQCKKNCSTSIKHLFGTNDNHVSHFALQMRESRAQLIVRSNSTTWGVRTTKTTHNLCICFLMLMQLWLLKSRLDEGVAAHLTHYCCRLLVLLLPCFRVSNTPCIKVGIQHVYFSVIAPSREDPDAKVQFGQFRSLVVLRYCF